MTMRFACATVLLALAAPPAGAAVPASISRALLLSGTAPPGCGTPPGAQLGAEAEPHLAVDPA
jgi:hypothetical protein